MVLPEIPLKIFKYKIVVYNLFLSCGNNYVPFSYQIVQWTAKNVLCAYNLIALDATLTTMFLHMALSFWPIRCVGTQNNTFWNIIIEHAKKLCGTTG